MPAQPDPHNPQPAPLPVPNPSKSFWHSEPSPFLLGHHTTEDLPKEADVVIVGSGITGASAARFLHEGGSADAVKNAVGSAKKTIVMLEAREACWGATGRVGSEFIAIHRCFTLLYAFNMPVLKRDRCSQIVSV
jgi:hypothetical protein